MVEEIYKNIYRIGVGLPGNPLKELNSYFIKGEKEDLLIDTGFRREACREFLEEGLKELGSDPDRRNVLITHLHSDHSGMADLFAGKNKKVYMSEIDLNYLKQQREGSLQEIRRQRFLKEGFPEDQLAEAYRTNPAITECLKEIDDRFVGLKNGQSVRAGGYELEMIYVPGHTPGNCMFYIRDEQIMFTGDHILFDITPNITYWPKVEDSLGNYIKSLKRVCDMPVKISFPGHRQTGVYRERIESLIQHHERRLAEAYSVVQENPGMCAYDIAGMMKWKIRAADWNSFPVIQKWFAVGECLSHLDYHLKRGRIRFEEKDGIRRYYVTEQ